tara:strand:- start:759 stop:950 length:192 start_codon:yes stop_codon:yes gene_type:complete
MPDFKIGGLVTSEYFEVGLLVAVYDHDTQDPADLSDAKTKLLEALVEVDGDTKSLFLHELAPL